MCPAGRRRGWLEQLGGQPGLNEGRLTDQLIEDGYDPDTATVAQKTEAKKSIAEQHLAIIFLKNADKVRYGGLIADLANRQARECDEYPRNLAKAFDMLTTWDRVTPSSQNATTNDQGLAYWTEDQSRNPGGRGRGRTGGRGGAPANTLPKCWQAEALQCCLRMLVHLGKTAEPSEQGKGGKSNSELRPEKRPRSNRKTKKPSHI